VSHEPGERGFEPQPHRGDAVERCRRALDGVHFLHAVDRDAHTFLDASVDVLVVFRHTVDRDVLGFEAGP
jgi:hypothetical protein